MTLQEVNEGRKIHRMHGEREREKEIILERERANNVFFNLLLNINL